LTDIKLEKGYALEEAIRGYFLSNGYYVVRGVPFVYRGYDVTDIDIWAYERPSSLSRHRVIVDCKNKTTPKAIERIFWTKGLAEVLGAEEAVVATTEKRSEIAEFGRRHGVMILDGAFLNNLFKASEVKSARLTEEQFTEMVSAYTPVKGVGDWKTRLRKSKQPLAGSLNFSSVNYWLEAGSYFAEQMQIVATHREAACRMVYLLVSFAAIALDYSLREYAFSDSDKRFAVVEQGLRTGSPGAASTSNVLDLATALIEQYAPENKGVATRIRQRLAEDLDKLPTKMLAQFICKPSVSSQLFEIAKNFEAAAYSVTFTAPHELGTLPKSFFLLFLDFWRMDRVSVLDGFQRPAGILISELNKAPATPADYGSTKAELKAAQPELTGLTASDEDD
jgi:hypothetical protein